MIREGEQAPGFSLPQAHGDPVSLADFRGQYVVLYFYPKDNTPGCTTEACDFRDYHQEFQDLNAVILGVSRDTLASHEKFIHKYDLPFRLLSDTEEEVCEKYGVLKEKMMFGKKRMGIERSTFLIDPQGKVIKIYRKVKVQDHVKEALEFLKSRKGRQDGD